MSRALIPMMYSKYTIHCTLSYACIVCVRVRCKFDITVPVNVTSVFSCLQYSSLCLPQSYVCYHVSVKCREEN